MVAFFEISPKIWSFNTMQLYNNLSLIDPKKGNSNARIHIHAWIIGVSVDNIDILSNLSDSNISHKKLLWQKKQEDGKSWENQWCNDPFSVHVCLFVKSGSIINPISSRLFWYHYSIIPLLNLAIWNQTRVFFRHGSHGNVFCKVTPWLWDPGWPTVVFTEA